MNKDFDVYGMRTRMAWPYTYLLIFKACVAAGAEARVPLIHKENLG